MATAELLERLAKVQRLAERASNEHEAAAAAAKLQQILFKHNLTLADVSAATADENSPAGREYGQHRFDIKYGDNWRRGLMGGIAEANFCRSLYTQGTPLVWLIGEAHNVEAVKQMYPYVEAEIIRLSNHFWRNFGRYTSTAGEASWKNSFRSGATYTVVQRLREAKQELAAEDAQSTALVRVTDDELDNAVANFFPQAREAGRRGGNKSGDGYRAGRLAGEQVPLEKQIGGGR